MPTNVYNRCLWLLNTLLVNRRLTFKEIQKKWGTSHLYEGKPLNLRTFHIHRAMVETMFNIKIVCDAKDGYRYSISDETPIQEDLALRWLYNTFNVSNLVSEGKMMTDRVLLEDIPEGTEYLQTIVEAMRQNRVLEVEYQPFYEEHPKNYHVQPYCLKVYRMRWYILGKFEEIGELRHISLDRTLNLEMTERRFKLPRDFSAEDYYRYAVGLWVNRDLTPKTVTLRAYGEQSKYLHTLPLHPSQKEVNRTAEFVDYRYEVLVTPDLVSELLRMGDKVEVLEPKELRTKMKAAATDIMNRYKKQVKNQLKFTNNGRRYYQR